MVPTLAHTDIRGRLILLGTGTSVGVPVIGCPCSVCNSDNPRNFRMRSAAIVGLPHGNLLIDTPPELRLQLVRERIGIVHAVIYTHEHADHLFGMDDIRLLPFYLGHPVPIFCEPQVEERIRQAYDYAFTGLTPTHAGAVPQITFHPITDLQPISILGQRVQPIRLIHGPRFQVLGFRIGAVAYCTDTNEIPESSWEHLEALDVLILDGLRRKPHPTHFCLAEAIDVALRVKAKQTYFTHVCHDLDYDLTNAELPPGMALAYDGLTICLTTGRELPPKVPVGWCQPPWAPSEASRNLPPN